MIEKKILAAFNIKISPVSSSKIGTIVDYIKYAHALIHKAMAYLLILACNNGLNR